MDAFECPGIQHLIRSKIIYVLSHLDVNAPHIMRGVDLIEYLYKIKGKEVGN